MSSLSTPGSHDLSRAAVGRSSPPEVTVWRSLAELPIVAKPTLPLGLAPVNLLKAVVVKFTPGGFGSVFATTVSVLDQPAGLAFEVGLQASPRMSAMGASDAHTCGRRKCKNAIRSLKRPEDTSRVEIGVGNPIKSGLPRRR